MGMNHLAERLWITAIATERLHEYRKARLGLDDQFQHDVVEVRAMIATIALGQVNDLFRGWLVAVIAPIDMKTRPLKVHIGWT